MATRRPVRILALAAASLLLLAAPAGAQGAAGLRIIAAGSCPAGADVADEVRRLLPAAEVSATSPGAEMTGDAVVTEDVGGVGVAVAGQTRRFDDPGQRCAERARMAAVFVAVVLDPPRFALPPPPPALVTTPPPSVAPPPRPLELELGPASQVAQADGVSSVPATAGGTARLLWGRWLRLSVGVTFLTATTLHFDRADVRGLWIPADVSVRLMRAARRWEGGAELGLAIVPVRLTGQGQALAPAEEGWRVEAGVRLAASLRYWLTERLGIFLSPHGSFFPRPYTLGVRDLGAVGETPRLWLGAQLGVAIRLR